MGLHRKPDCAVQEFHQYAGVFPVTEHFPGILFNQLRKQHAVLGNRNTLRRIIVPFIYSAHRRCDPFFRVITVFLCIPHQIMKQRAALVHSEYAVALKEYRFPSDLCHICHPLFA